MQFTFASLQVFIIAGIVLQFAAGSPIGLGKPVDTDPEDGGDKLLWLNNLTPAKRGKVGIDSEDDGDKLLWLQESSKPVKRVTIAEVASSEDGDARLDWLNNSTPENLKRDKAQDGDDAPLL
ncbi:hypothetical protein C8J57DRAFT_1301516 [Mycena rebaudengoi]|nr:hypothetical protein C8J57DRAFT_1301516 [Mycena rebaudengoi]